MTSQGQLDFFIARLEYTGDLGWVQSGGGDLDDRIADVSLAGSQLFVTGQFTGFAHFGSQELAPFGSTEPDIFLAKVNPVGEPLWALTAGSNAGWDAGVSLLVHDNDLYWTGYFHETAFFGDIGLPFEQAGDNIFLAKVSAGTSGLWAGPEPAEEVKIFPNPFFTHLTVQLDAACLAKAQRLWLSIRAENGTLVHQQLITTASQNLNLPVLPAGRYLFRLENPEREFLWQKFLLKSGE